MVAERVYQAGELVGVLTTEPLGRVLDYKAPEGGCGDGDFVEVPLGPRRVIGVVWGPGEGKFDPARIRRDQPGAGCAANAGRVAVFSDAGGGIYADADGRDAAAGHPRAGVGRPAVDAQDLCAGPVHPEPDDRGAVSRGRGVAAVWRRLR